MSNRSKYPGTDQTITGQHYLGNRGLIVFLALLSAFVPLSIDLYLPALPAMTEYFHVHEYQTNLTLILFFIFFSIGTLIWGPLSDKYGRKPILIVGLTGYTVASALCALSLDIYQLMFFRVLQAVGGSAASAVATAIVKDVYQGKRLESTLALVQSMVIISPVAAPVIGAILLTFTSWRGAFVIQAGLGIIVFIGSIAFQETLKSRSHGSIVQTIGRLAVVFRNPGFSMLLIIFSMVSISTMAFISSSSYIYQETFRVSSQVYSYYFAFNAAGMLVGPLIYIKLAERFNKFSIINTCFAVMILSGFLICLFGVQFGPWVFAVVLLPSTVVVSCTRPPSTYLMLDQQQEDTGSASALMSSCTTVMGSIGMVIASFDLGNLVQLVGALNIIFGVLCGGLWLAATRRPFLSSIRHT